jgi:hypothetical protein
MKSLRLLGVLAGILGATILGGPALAQQVTWKVAIFGPPRAVTVTLILLFPQLVLWLPRTMGMTK